MREYDGKMALLYHVRKRGKLGSSAGRSAEETRKYIYKKIGKEYYGELAKKQS